MKTQLSLSTLGALDDGRAGEVINRAITEAALDCDARAEQDGKPRAVNIKLTFTRDSHGNIEVDVSATAKLPPRRTEATVTTPRARRDGELALFFETEAGEEAPAMEEAAS